LTQELEQQSAFWLQTMNEQPPPAVQMPPRH
jgi:hypothetical protein